MGHQIEAGERGIHTTAESWLVANWCNYLSPAEKPDDMSNEDWIDEQSGGGTHIYPVAVKATDAIIPLTFAEATAGGYLSGDYLYSGRGPIDEEGFRVCRDFLRYAAEGGYEIRGSY